MKEVGDGQGRLGEVGGGREISGGIGQSQERLGEVGGGRGQDRLVKVRGCRERSREIDGSR